jgi:transcriptional regulator of acetoin/glycerol metabolism
LRFLQGILAVMRFQPGLEDADPPATFRAWQRFSRGEAIDESVRPHVRAAWQRSREHGCSPYMPRADVLPAAETLALLRQQSRLIEVASPFLAALSRAAGPERHAAMLGDATGRVLKIVADPLTAADEAFPRSGSLLSEAAAGANGIGTALAGDRYVELVGPEHYIEGFHPFTCQGVPLHVAPDAPAGVVSMSVRRVETAHRIRDILFCASEAAECELLSAELSSTAATAGERSAVLESLRQDVVQRIAVTRLQLEIAARRIASVQDASAMLESAERLIAKFRRQAAIWRNLADDAVSSPEPIDLADLVHQFLELMQTEARVAGVTLEESRLERVLALDDAGALSRRLLTGVLSGLQRAAPGTCLRFSLEEADPRIRIEGTAVTGETFRLPVPTTQLR